MGIGSTGITLCVFLRLRESSHWLFPYSPSFIYRYACRIRHITYSHERCMDAITRSPNWRGWKSPLSVFQQRNTFTLSAEYKVVFYQVLSECLLDDPIIHSVKKRTLFSHCRGLDEFNGPDQTHRQKYLPYCTVSIHKIHRFRWPRFHRVCRDDHSSGKFLHASLGSFFWILFHTVMRSTI